MLLYDLLLKLKNQYYTLQHIIIVQKPNYYLLFYIGYKEL